MNSIRRRFSKYLISLLISLFISSCSDNSVNDPEPISTSPVNITILYTNDEHGWMEPNNGFGGAAGLMGLWRNVEGYSEDGPFLILSGGDMWTGPALSTWFEGESMSDVMNAMNYSAAAVGNHEVDFGIDKLTLRSNQSDFPFLSANIVIEGTYDSPVWCKPYIVKNVNGVSVGIIGLTTNTMPSIVFPEYLNGLTFISYEEALYRAVNEAKTDGAELLILIAHMSAGELKEISNLAGQLGISIMGGGHSHEFVNEVTNGVTLVEAGSKMRAYAKIEVSFDTEKDEVISVNSGYFENKEGTPDAEIESIVNSWISQAENVLNEVIGYVENRIGQNTDEMFNLITDSWLYSFPNADISISNRGGVRQSIPAGDISVASIMGVLPFENEIVELDFTGTELTNLINTITNYAFVGGMTTIEGYKLADDTNIIPNDTYRVLTTDYYYSTTPDMQEYDPEPEYSYVNWRQPVIDYIRSLNTSSGNPLDNYLDDNPRQTGHTIFEY